MQGVHRRTYFGSLSHVGHTVHRNASFGVRRLSGALPLDLPGPSSPHCPEVTEKVSKAVPLGHIDGQQVAAREPLVPLHVLTSTRKTVTQLTRHG